MASIITASVAFEMIAATSAHAAEPDPMSIEGMIVEMAHAICGRDQNRAPSESDLARSVPADNAAGRAPCGQVALHHAMSNRQSARDISFQS